MIQIRYEPFEWLSCIVRGYWNTNAFFRIKNKHLLVQLWSFQCFAKLPCSTLVLNFSLFFEYFDMIQIRYDHFKWLLCSLHQYWNTNAFFRIKNKHLLVQLWSFQCFTKLPCSTLVLNFSLFFGFFDNIQIRYKHFKCLSCIVH